MRGVQRRRRSQVHRITLCFRLFGRTFHDTRFPQMIAAIIIAMSVLPATFVACATPVSSPQRLEGVWGGDQVQLEAAADGVSIQFPCAAGRIDPAIQLDANGRFDVAGTFIRIHPVRHSDGEGRPRAEPVRYTGKVTGDELALSLHFENSNDEHFTLTRGQTVHVPVCAALRYDEPSERGAA